VWVCGHLLVGIVCSNPAGGVCMVVSSGCCVLLGRGLCVKLISHAAEFHKV